MLWKAGLARTNNLPRTAVTARYTTSQCLAHHSFTGLAETFPSRTARATLTVTVLAPRLCPRSLEYSFPVPVSLSLPVPPPLSPLPLSLFFFVHGDRSTFSSVSTPFLSLSPVLFRLSPSFSRGSISRQVVSTHLLVDLATSSSSQTSSDLHTNSKLIARFSHKRQTNRQIWKQTQN